MVKMKMHKPHIIRRLSASIIDFLLSFLMFMILFIFVVQPLYNKFTNVQEISSSYYSALHNTGLYTYEEETKLCYINTPKFQDQHTATIDDYKNYYEHRIYEYFSSNSMIDVYNQFKIDSGLFVYDNGVYLFKNNVTVTQAKNFYTSAIGHAIDEIFLKNETNLANKALIQRYNEEIIIISLLPPAVLFYLIVPLLFDGGQTFGKKMLNLKLASIETGFEVKKSTILLRQAVVLIIGYLMGFYTSLLSTIAFIVMPFIHKRGASIDDFLCNTIVYENIDINEEKGNIITVALKEKKKVN